MFQSHHEALLLPKLRSQFAEFLNVDSIERLRIFSSPTCVGLRYGLDLFLLEAFLGSVASAHSPYSFRVTGLLNITPADLPAGLYQAQTENSVPADIAFCVTPSIKHQSRCRILTRFPSPTPLGLGLGPTDPGRISLAQETLGFRRTGFSPVLSLLVPTFSLLLRPQLLAVLLLTTAERSPTAHKDRSPHEPVVSVICLAPLHFRRRSPRPVSYYALFKGMAASKPTSWLSGDLHILSHSAYTLGP